jgi:hypothetical protein
MTLSDSESLRFYRTISARAREVGLDWIVDQVEEQLALGNVALRSLSVREPDLFSAEPEIFAVKSRRRKSTRATFLVSRPYTAQEQLELLVDSLLIGVVQLNQIADKVISFVASELDSTSIEFAPEAEVKPILRLETESARVAEASEKLESLLNELKREIADAL